MNDKDKSTEQLLNELRELRRRVSELEDSEAKLLSTEKPLKGSKESQRLLHEDAPPGSQSLDDSKRMLKGILAASPVGISLSRSREIQWVNDAWLRMFGFEDDRECVGQNTRILYRSQEEYERIGALLYGKSATAEVTEADAEFKRKDGSIFYGLIRVKALNPSDPAEPVIVAISDITERKHAEESLRASEERLELALWGADLGLWDRYVHSGEAVANQRSAEIVGYSLDEIEQSFDFWKSLLHPEDSQRVLDRVSNHLAGLTDYYEDEYRVRTKSGDWKWILSRGKVVERDKDGRALRVTGTYLDISARKQAEEAVRKSEARYRSLFDNMLEGFSYCRMLFEDGKPQDFIYLDVNDAFTRLTGLKNVIGKKVTEVIPGVKESNPELFEIYGRVALTGVPEKLETYVDPLGIWFSISVYSSEKEYFVAVFDNITGRKRAQEALQSSERMMKSILSASPVGIALTKEREIQWVNDAWSRMFGFEDDDECVGQSSRIVYPSQEEYDRVGKLLYERFATGEVMETDAEFQRKDGSTFYGFIRTKALNPSDPAEGSNRGHFRHNREETG